MALPRLIGGAILAGAAIIAACSDDDDKEEDDDVYMAGEWISSLIRIYDDKLIYYID